MEVDFTTDPPTKDHHDTFNAKVFKQLLSAEPAGDWEQGGIPSTQTGLTEDTSVNPEETPEEVPGESSDVTTEVPVEEGTEVPSEEITE